MVIIVGSPLGNWSQGAFLPNKTFYWKISRYYMMKTRFVFVVATAKPEGIELPIQKTLARMNTSDFGIETKVCVEYNNKVGLSTVYNKFLDNNPDCDFVVFLHDDLWLNDVLFFDKVIDANKANGYDVIGVCGGKKWSLVDAAKPNIWTRATSGAGASGFMIHAPTPEFANESQSYNGRSYAASNYGFSPSKTLTLDGSILIMSKKAIDAGLRFDEQFGFHFYDMDFCITAVKKHKLVVGTAPFIATHESLGQSVAQPEFMEAQKKFVAKWFGGQS